ncbi:MAG: hypothetical protein F6K28_24215, partial [Microcoleus sp. SIO2G3]|nr:hypothetical protein [Microcoleus sp. SIO2G3]
MKHKNLGIFAWLAQCSVILSTFLLSVDLANAQSANPNAPESTPTSVISNQERQELERLREERRISEQVQVEASRAFTRTTTLFNIMLATLALLLAGSLVALFLLRRAVIREVAELVRTHLNEVGDLEGKIKSANQQAQTLLQETEEIGDEINTEAQNFQQELGSKREHLSQLLSEVSQSKKQALTELEAQIQEAKQALEKLESEFTARITELHLDAQQQKSLIFQNLEQLSAGFTPELSAIQEDVQARKKTVLQNLELSENEFAAALSALHLEAQHQ